MVLYNCGHPANQGVNLSMINSQPGSYLHRFSWITDDSLIGAIDYEWNFLVEWYKPYEGEEKAKGDSLHGRRAVVPGLQRDGITRKNGSIT